MEFTRSFALEDISVRSGGDGRTVEAYATVFNTPAYVRDQDGEYEEVIDPTAFDRTLEHKRRSKSPIPVLFNHGMTLFHTPSEMDSVAIGVVEEIKADKRGLFTRARYHDTPRAHEVLEAIRSRAITSYSFSGVFKKSTPNVPRGGFRRSSDGTLPVVRRNESTLRELGPAQFAVYEGAEVVGVRAEQIARSMFNMDPEERQRLAALISGTQYDPSEIDTALEEALVTEDPPEEALRSASPKQILMANYANFLRRSA